jgi:hypothetical protein
MFNLALSYEFPLGVGKPFLNQRGVWNGVLGGWKLSSNFTAQSGVPLAISCAGNALSSRCNLIGNPNFPGGRSKADRIQQWINPAAFEPPFGSDPAVIQAITTGSYPDGTPFDYNSDIYWKFGNSGPRLPGIRSPGFWNLDTGLSKAFPITESKRFEFRWELFNALNHQNLGFPNTNFCLPPNPDGTYDGLVRYPGCSFGRITNVQTDPRAMQFALKFFW